MGDSRNTNYRASIIAPHPVLKVPPTSEEPSTSKVPPFTNHTPASTSGTHSSSTTSGKPSNRLSFASTSILSKLRKRRIDHRNFDEFQSYIESHLANQSFHPSNLAPISLNNSVSALDPAIISPRDSMHDKIQNEKDGSYSTEQHLPHQHSIRMRNRNPNPDDDIDEEELIFLQSLEQHSKRPILLNSNHTNYISNTSPGQIQQMTPTNTIPNRDLNVSSSQIQYEQPISLISNPIDSILDSEINPNHSVIQFGDGSDFIKPQPLKPESLYFQAAPFGQWTLENIDELISTCDIHQSSLVLHLKSSSPLQNPTNSMYPHIHNQFPSFTSTFRLVKILQHLSQNPFPTQILSIAHKVISHNFSHLSKGRILYALFKWLPLELLPSLVDSLELPLDATYLSRSSALHALCSRHTLDTDNPYILGDTIRWLVRSGVDPQAGNGVYGRSPAILRFGL